MDPIRAPWDATKLEDETDTKTRRISSDLEHTVILKSQTSNRCRVLALGSRTTTF